MVNLPKSQLKSGLTLVATPIGNASDLSLRAIQALRDADLLVAEDTRMLRRLMDVHGIPMGERKALAYHDHNAEKVLPRILSEIEKGARVICTTDAGTPMVADPGYRLACAIIDADLPLSAVPGPCAAIMALTLSGLPSDRFLFAGFPPPKAQARRTTFAELSGVPATLIFYESPKRLAASLADMAQSLGARPAAVARELSKMFEEVRRGTLEALAEHYAQAGAPKGEIAVVIGPPAPAEAASEADIDAALGQALETMSVKDAAQIVAVQLGLKKRDVYARALAITQSR